MFEAISFYECLKIKVIAASLIYSTETGKKRTAAVGEVILV
jgi:hypothetical protein